MHVITWCGSQKDGGFFSWRTSLYLARVLKSRRAHLVPKGTFEKYVTLSLPTLIFLGRSLFYIKLSESRARTSDKLVNFCLYRSHHFREGPLRRQASSVEENSSRKGQNFKFVNLLQLCGGVCVCAEECLPTGHSRSTRPRTQSWPTSFVMKIQTPYLSTRER